MLHYEKTIQSSSGGTGCHVGIKKKTTRDVISDGVRWTKAMRVVRECHPEVTIIMPEEKIQVRAGDDVRSLITPYVDAIGYALNHRQASGHVIEALVEEIQGNLANGDKVKLNQLGTLHMTFRCPGVETSDKCTVRNITKVNIRFIPDKGLRLVNGSTATTRSAANVNFVLDKPEESGNGSGGNTGGGAGDENDNPLG